MPRGFTAHKARAASIEARRQRDPSLLGEKNYAGAAHAAEPRSERQAHAANQPLAGRFMGDVSPTATWEALRTQSEAVLVDVRTRPEWVYVGGPDLSSLGKSVIQVEWQTYPTMERNPHFLKELREHGVTPQQVVYIICRSGIRSRDAAEWLAAFGYTTYNVAEGFEGPLDAQGHRGHSGWRAEQLPWKQS